MSTPSPLFKNDTPLTVHTFTEDDGSVFPGLPTDTTKYIFYIHAPDGIRTSAGAISNLNTTAGTLNLQLTSTDTGVTGVATIWWVVQLSNGPRTFDPQKVLIEDPTQA